MSETWVVLRRSVVGGVPMAWRQVTGREFETRTAARRWIAQQHRATGDEFRAVRVGADPDPEERDFVTPAHCSAA